MSFVLRTLLTAFCLLLPQANTQQNASTQAQALASLGQNAVAVITSTHSVDAGALVAKTGKPLSTKGKWSISTHRPAACPDTTESCISVSYNVAEVDATCEWTVLLLGDGSSGHVVEENDDAARYFITNLTPSDASDLILKRHDPVYPPIAEAAHVSGAVLLRVQVDTDGNVSQVRSLGGPPMLIGAATNGAKLWKFKPLLVGDRGVRFETNIKMVFLTNGPRTGKITVWP